MATRDPNYEAIGRRIHTILFLGTPHRGADSASVAKLVRQSAGYGSKPFLDDLIPGSGTLDVSLSNGSSTRLEPTISHTLLQYSKSTTSLDIFATRLTSGLSLRVYQ